MYSVGNKGSTFTVIFMVKVQKSDTYINNAGLTSDMASKSYYNYIGHEK